MRGVYGLRLDYSRKPPRLVTVFLFSALYADCLYIHLILPETSTKLSVIYVLWLFNSDIHFSCPLFLLIQIFTDLISLKLSFGCFLPFRLLLTGLVFAVLARFLRIIRLSCSFFHFSNPVGCASLNRSLGSFASWALAFNWSYLCLLVLLTQANFAKPSPSARSRYTRLFFGGRHPLCGIGVTSLINVISKPAAWIALIAVSLPDPGPLMCTSTFFIP